MSEKTPVTAAIRVLRQHNAAFGEHLYAYEAKGGTAVAAREMGVPEHAVIKTLVMEDETGRPLIVLMHGDCEVSTKNLARLLGRKTIAPCAPDTANKHSGYLVGGTSPFGTHKPMPVYMQESILALDRIYLNGGKRGFQVSMKPADAQAILEPVLVNVAIAHDQAGKPE